jgi:hypothetical protein
MTECVHENPREWDNLGIFLGFHRRYNLGDKIEPNDEYKLNTDDFEGWNEIEAHIYKHFDPAVVYRVYMIDHSGLAFNVSGFGCPWDSGPVGFIFAPKDKVREWYDVKRISKKKLQDVRNSLVAEIKDYDDWHSGTCCYEEEQENDD